MSFTNSFWDKVFSQFSSKRKEKRSRRRRHVRRSLFETPEPRQLMAVEVIQPLGEKFVPEEKVVTCSGKGNTPAPPSGSMKVVDSPC
jgi:hypothetical protein